MRTNKPFPPPARLRRAIPAALCAAIPALALAAAPSPFTPVRPLAYLKSQDPADIIRLAPTNAEMRLPARTVKSMYSKGVELVAITNALTEGQIYLQGQIAYWQEQTEAAERKAARAEALRAWLVEMRDAAKLATTKAIYQAIIDKLDEQTEAN